MVTQSKRLSHPVINTCVMVVLFILTCVWSGYNRCQTEKKQEEVRLVVRLEEREVTPSATRLEVTDVGKEMGIVSGIGVWQPKWPEKIPLITITNKSKKPIGMQDITLKDFHGRKMYWENGWLDASSNNPIVFPFYLKPDTSLQLTCASAIDTTVLNFNTLYIELVETGEKKQYALRWE